MSQLSLVLQETVRRGREATTLLEILRDTMDGGDVAERGGVERRPSFKQRLRLSGIGCCGAAWGIGRTVTIEDDPTEEQQPQQHHQQQQQQQLPQLSELIILAPQNSDPECFGPNPVQSGSGMNLAAALAAERQYREPLSEYTGGGDTSAPPATPMRVSLMRLLEETETDDVAGEGEKCGGGGGSDWVCCVCMGRKKGAAFIPCGHTFCRVCSREVWLNRGTCPLCNRTILEILDIF